MIIKKRRLDLKTEQCPAHTERPQSPQHVKTAAVLYVQDICIVRPPRCLCGPTLSISNPWVFTGVSWGTFL